jgi:putative transposase
MPKSTGFVYAKPPFGGPEHVPNYLARYTHRVAISNHRLLSFDGQQVAGQQVAFRWKDYAHGNKKRKMTLTADEFLRRFLLHVDRDLSFAGPNPPANFRVARPGATKTAEISARVTHVELTCQAAADA